LFDDGAVPYALTRPRLWYERRGAGEPLLVITGFAISSAIFEPLLDLYAQRFDCITYDHRGSGRSGARLRPTSMPELAADAARLLDAIGVDSAHVYGVSMGGMVALELALRFPERVRGLVLGCTTAGGPLAVRPSLRELRVISAVAAGELRKPGRPWLATFLFSPAFRRDHPDRVAFLLEHFHRHRPSPHGAAAQFWATVFHDTVARLPRIQAPTLVFHGEHDVMSPLGNSQLLAQRIPDAELAVVEGAGHAYALERPEESFALLCDWHDRHAPISAGRRRDDLAVLLEPVTRPFGLPIGALRTSRSFVEMLRERGGARG
jgi:pimeloyl-ACP methyl ester carboxylesterase